MPINTEWGEEQKEEYVAQVIEMREELDIVETEEGQDEIRRIYVDLTDIDPEVMSRFPLRFRASTHRNASWTKWLNAIEYLGFKLADPKLDGLRNPNKVIGNWLHIRMEPMTSDINGNLIEWQFPRPLAVLTSEGAAKEVFDKLPKVAKPVPAVDLETRQEVFGLYKSLSTLPTGRKSFLTAVADMLPEGMTPEQAWTMAEKEASVDTEDML